MRTCIYTYTISYMLYVHMYTYIYIYMYVYICVSIDWTCSPGGMYRVANAHPKPDIASPLLSPPGRLQGER